MTELAPRFAALFAGLDRVYGTYKLDGTLRDDGKREGGGVTKQAPVTLELWERHLAGEQSLGIVPIREDSTCSWGAIDIDSYKDFDPAAIVQRSVAAELPLVVCRSKSGGAHCYLFATEPIPAPIMRARLKEIAAALGYGTAEIFPEQSYIHPGDCGSWLNMAYFGGGSDGRHAIRPDGSVLSAEEFLKIAARAARPPAYFDTPIQVELESVGPSGHQTDSREEDWKAPFDLPDVIEPGARDTTLSKVIYRARVNLGFSRSELEALALATNKRCTPPYDEGLLKYKARHVAGRTPPAGDRVLPETINADREATLRQTGAILHEWLHSRQEIEAALQSVNQGRVQPPLPAATITAIAADVAKMKRRPRGKAAIQGRVPAIEAYVKKGHHFARDAGDLLYVFQGGTYRAAGERLIKKLVKLYCAENKTVSWSPQLAPDLTRFITDDAPELLERPPMDTVNVANGLLDVRTCTLRPHDPGFLSPIQLSAAYDPAARCPAVEKFCDEVFPEDSQHIPFEIVAWLMLPETSLQKAVLLVGEGGNGKSAFLTLLGDFLGADNVSSVTLHKIESDRFAASRLVGKLANICADLPTSALASTSMFKGLTGGDLVAAERKFSAGFDFRPYARLVFSANTPPRSDDATPGFFRRWIVIPFERATFSETDPATIPSAILRNRLAAPAELSGLLNRALTELPRIQSGRFSESDSTRAAALNFRNTTDPLAVWLDAHTIEDPEASIVKWSLRDLYKSDCRDNGRGVLAENQFTGRLRQLRPRVTTAQKRINGQQQWCFCGIDIRPDEPAGPRPVNANLFASSAAGPF
jgi:putative DNA primase/helicase